MKAHRSFEQQLCLIEMNHHERERTSEYFPSVHIRREEEEEEKKRSFSLELLMYKSLTLSVILWSNRTDKEKKKKKLREKRTTTLPMDEFNSLSSSISSKEKKGCSLFINSFSTD